MLCVISLLFESGSRIQWIEHNEFSSLLITYSFKNNRGKKFDFFLPTHFWWCFNVSNRIVTLLHKQHRTPTSPLQLSDVALLVLTLVAVVQLEIFKLGVLPVQYLFQKDNKMNILTFSFINDHTIIIFMSLSTKCALFEHCYYWWYYGSLYVASRHV